jgi:hypothetical protein
LWFLADPARTDLELIDPASRTVRGHYTWTFPRLQFMNGVRPDILDLIKIESPPGWFCAEGWHLTPETLGFSEKQPQPRAVAYLRRRGGPLMLMVGGRYLDAAAGADVAMSMTLDGRLVDTWVVSASQPSFLRRLMLPPEQIVGQGMAELVVSYGPSRGAAAPPRIWLTQFAAQSPSEIFFVPLEGWWEIEYGAQLQRRWRWLSDRSTTFVNNAGQAVVVRLAGESPLRYFDTPPQIVVRAGGQQLATASPSEDFDLSVRVPAAALAASDGMLTIETDKSFVPGEESGSLDRRRLGLRIFEFDVSRAPS